MNQTIIKHTSTGTVSKKEITVEFKEGTEHGIFFVLNGDCKFEAHVKNLASATRNTVLGKNNKLLCFVEHLLAGINLLRIKQIEIQIDGQEVPLIDGSAAPWIELLKNWPHKEEINSTIEISETLSVADDKGRAIIAYPSDEFKMTYLFESPVDGTKTWTNWCFNDGIEKLAKARTFGPTQEHEMLGIKGKWLSYDQNGFDLELNDTNEPALHKLLDLFGDLSLCGVNPLKLKAHFISVKGGHSLNTQMSAKFSKIL